MTCDDRKRFEHLVAPDVINISRCILHERSGRKRKRPESEFLHPRPCGRWIVADDQTMTDHILRDMRRIFPFKPNGFATHLPEKFPDFDSIPCSEYQWKMDFIGKSGKVISGNRCIRETGSFAIRIYFVRSLVTEFADELRTAEPGRNFLYRIRMNKAGIVPVKIETKKRNTNCGAVPRVLQVPDTRYLKDGPHFNECTENPPYLWQVKKTLQEVKRFTVTSALPYANGGLHLGHIAGAYLPADIYVRYLRSRGKDVLFVCGTDEHGAAISIQARKEGVSPKALVDKYYDVIREGFEAMNIRFDVFSRTSHPIHHQTAQEFFLQFHEKGLLEERSTKQLYDEKAEMFLADRFVKGTCPKCGNDSAYGDQCEKCGSSLNATDLINPVSTVSGSKPVLKETKHWFLPLNQYQERLEEFILRGHPEWKSNVYGQCKSWLKEGLQPRAITRDIDWGIPVPLPGAEGKVLYVWFDAPIGYISATKDWAEQQKKKGIAADWEQYWKKDPETALVHFIGKDNIVFHCIIFPAILMGQGEYNLPDDVPANEFLNLEGEKLSTSRNHAVWVNEFAKDFPGKSDVLRYVLAATMPENKDNDFSWKDFQSRNANELLANLGNFVRRVEVMTQKNFGAKVPVGTFNDVQVALLAEARKLLDSAGKNIEKFRFRDALGECMEIVRIGNRHLAETEPWKIVNDDPDAVKAIVRFSLELTAIAAVAFAPFLPETSTKLGGMLSINPTDWDAALRGELLKPGWKVGEAGHLFTRIEDDAIEAQLAKLKAAKPEVPIVNTTKSIPVKELISFEDFQKMDIRVGTILSAEKMPKADKLLKLEIDTGVEKRTVVSGVAEFYDPQYLVGKQATILLNLAPRLIKGVESQGMLLFAEDSSGKLNFVGPHEAVENGSLIR